MTQVNFKNLKSSDSFSSLKPATTCRFQYSDDWEIYFESAT